MSLTIPAVLPFGAEDALIRVLLADDSAAIRTLARFTLSAKRGFALVGEAADGAAALALFDQHRPDCVVLDIEMPGMGGFEALAMLRQRSPELPVVMLSGYADEATAQKATECGAAAYVDKGQGLVALADVVRRVTEACSSRKPAVTVPQRATSTEPATEPAAAEAPALAGSTPMAPHHEQADPHHPSTSDQAATDLRRLEYVVSHDFAEPARVISGFATLLDTRYGDSLDDSGRLFLRHLVGGAGRLQSMIDDLLIYSRAGRAPISSNPVDVTSVVNRARDGLASKINERKAEVLIGELPAVLGDAASLQLVFHHLLLNAITFNTAEVPRVQVAGRAVGEFAHFTVTDNGIGVAPSQCDEVFELFRRLNTREDYPGTGTGLALCRRLVEMHGGTIRLNSDSVGTSTVTVRIPFPPD